MERPPSILNAWKPGLMHIPGLKVAMPSTPYDAKGLLISAIRDDNPVVFLEHKMLYGTQGEVPEESYAIPLGKADVKREGKDITVVATAMMVGRGVERRRETGRQTASASRWLIRAPFRRWMRRPS